ncbi:hypothetical protein BC829DRAFT_168786 [Chytridium lagenaria]|nr:hypothetical protein BC829DRAFT_168786 [Chytridium lagenaria]
MPSLISSLLVAPWPHLQPWCLRLLKANPSFPLLPVLNPMPRSPLCAKPQRPFGSVTSAPPLATFSKVARPKGGLPTLTRMPPTSKALSSFSTDTLPAPMLCNSPLRPSRTLVPHLHSPQPWPRHEAGRLQQTRR